MATFTAIKNRGGGSGALGGVLHYVQQEEKTTWEDRQLVCGWNCTAQSVYDEMRLTKEQFHKTNGRQYYHFVQSFGKQDDLSPQEVHTMGLELAQREFPNFEVLVATHVDTGHFHNHLVVNSVSFQDGKKLHQSAADLQAHRMANDEICAAHGLETLPPPQKQVKQKRMGTREYRSAVKGESWKFRLMNTIDQCMKYAATREEFISLMKSEGYKVRWTENRKNITYTTPAGMKCRDRVISVTEGLDTTSDEDDLVIGVRGLMNDYYARDIGKKIRSGYRQKQREGIVITPPFGYWKDRNTNTVQLHPEAAETVWMIYSLYLQGFGQKEIARRLNDLGRKTPAQIRAEQCGREVRAAHKTRDNRYLWTYASVKNVLIDEAYTGVLINHRSETQDGKVKRLEQTEWYRHETFFPVIVEPDVWKLVQQRLKERARPANGNRSKHRYAGLLRCQECGNVFVPMIRYWNGKRRVEYVCRGYQRSGKSYCSSHRIHEEVLDAAVQEFAQTMRIKMVEEQKELKQKQKMWALRKPVLDAHIFALQEKIQALEQEIDDISMEYLKGNW